VVLYFHSPICLYGVIRDIFILPNLRNFLYETIVTLYEMYMYIYVCVCVCACVCVCLLHTYFHCAVKRTDNIKELNKSAIRNNGL
jgi:CDP-diglyceride synthetase